MHAHTCADNVQVRIFNSDSIIVISSFTLNSFHDEFTIFNSSTAFWQYSGKSSLTGLQIKEVIYLCLFLFHIFRFQKLIHPLEPLEVMVNYTSLLMKQININTK